MDSEFLVPYYGFQIPGFRSLLQTFTGFSVPQENTSRIRNPESLIFYMRRSLIAFLFLLLLLSICSPDSIYVCTVQYHKVYLLFVQRLSYVLFLFVLTERPRELFAADPHTYRRWNLYMLENLVMTSAYARCLSIQTLRVGVKKLGRVENEASDICVAVPFDQKLTILRKTNGVARVKIGLKFLVFGLQQHFRK